MAIAMQVARHEADVAARNLEPFRMRERAANIVEAARPMLT
jgi:hypothetical protein